MPIELAENLYSSGRSHALSAVHLYRYSLLYAEDEGIEDRESFAFNGVFSLSVHYLLGLGLELMLKAAIVEWSGDADNRQLRDLGHDLPMVLSRAEEEGFRSTAPHLREILNVLNEPFKRHWLRYNRPENFELPGDFNQVTDTLHILDEEIGIRIRPV